MPTDDRYAGIAGAYDAMLADDPERTAFFRALFGQAGKGAAESTPIGGAPAKRRVLDCACGTGRDLVMLHEAGFEVAGSDLSAAMLRVARARLEAAGLDLPLARLDFHRLGERFGREFDAVVCLSNAINEQEVDAARALASMRAVLRPGGLIVFDQGQTDFSLQDPPLFHPMVNDRDLSRLYTMRYGGGIMTVNVFDFVHVERENRYEFRHSEFPIRIRLLADWQEVLRQAGLEARFLGSWSGEPYDPRSSRRLIAVVRTPAAG